MRVDYVAWTLLFCLSGCGPLVVEPDTTQTRYVTFVPGPLRPDNCGTPDHYKNCPPSGVRRAVVSQTKTFVTIEEIGGAPAQEANYLPLVE